MWKISRSCGPCFDAVRCAQPIPAQQTEIRRPPSARGRSVDRRLHRLLLHHVGLHEAGAVARARRRAPRPSRRSGRRSRPRRPRACRARDGGGAEPGGSAGDQRACSVDLHGAAGYGSRLACAARPVWLARVRASPRRSPQPRRMALVRAEGAELKESIAERLAEARDTRSCADRAAHRGAAQPRLLADPQPADLGPGPHRELRGALAGAPDRRPRAAARRPRRALRRDRAAAQDPRRAADPPRRRGPPVHGAGPRAHARGARGDRPRLRRPAARGRLHLRDAPRPRAPAQRDDAAAAADDRGLRAGRRWTTRSSGEPVADGPEMVRVEGGSHEIGAASRGFAYDNERPRHEVELAPFWIDRTPVTNGDYIALHGGNRRRAADVLGARRRGRLGPDRDGYAPRRWIPRCP